MTKKCYLMLSDANKQASDNQNANFCYADENYRLQIRWNDDNQEDFFDTLEDLREFSRLLSLLIKFLYYLLELLLVKFVFW